MPELPEVETVRRGLNQVSRQQVVLGGEVLLARSIAYPLDDPDELQRLKGSYITTWQRRGKYLLAALAADPQVAQSPIAWLGVHLRMTGQLLWLPQQHPLQTHTRIRLFFPHQQELRFVDQRTFGRMWLVPTGVPVEQVMTGLQHLGPEPLSIAFTPDYLAGQLQGRGRSIKTALLDQTLVAGVGNIYADEALFLSGIRPDTPCGAISMPQVERLHAAVVSVLNTAIEAGGTTFSDFLNVQGINGNYGGNAWVYNRKDQPCRTCGSSIQRIRLGGRSSHYCPQCQS